MTGEPKELSAERLAEIRGYLGGDWKLTAMGSMFISLLDHIDALTARIAELTKPVGDAEVWAMSSQLTRLNSFGERMNADGERASAMLLTLTRENAALKVLIAKDGEILARLIATERNLADAEAKLAEAVAALESARRDALEEAAKLFDGSRAFSNDERLMLEQCAAAIRALTQPKVTP